MGCSCETKDKDGNTIMYTAVLPGNKIKRYNSKVARDAIVKNTPGAYAEPDPVVST